MKAEKISAILKFISIVFFALFILLMIFSIVSYTNKKIFITLLTLFLLFIIPFFIFYKYSVKIYSKNSYKKIKENKEKLNHIPLNYSILKDYQKAILELKEKNTYILGRFDVIYSLNKNYKKDMKRARKIQEAMINKKILKNKFISSACFYEPFEIIGGDFFDYVYINENRILFIMSDISGHGVEAAIVTSMIKTTFRNLSNSFNSVSSLLFEINNYLVDTLPADFYLTMIIADIDFESKKINYSNASHTPLLLIKDKEIIEYSKGGTIVGLFKNAFYEEDIIELNNGDIFLFFTDGIIEASQSKNKYDIYGINKLKKIISANKNLDADALMTIIKNDFYEYLSYRSPDDDCSMLLFKVK